MLPRHYGAHGLLLWSDGTATLSLLKTYSRRCRLPQGEHPPTPLDGLLDKMQAYYGNKLKRVIVLSPERN